MNAKREPCPELVKATTRVGARAELQTVEPSHPKGVRKAQLATETTTTPDEKSPLVAFVTDATAPHVLGMSARAFRDAVRSQRIPHRKLGARILVHVDDLRALTRTSSDAPSELAEEHEPTVDDVLAHIGRRRA